MPRASSFPKGGLIDPKRQAEAATEARNASLLNPQVMGNQARDRANIRAAQNIAPTPFYAPQPDIQEGVNVFTGQKAPTTPTGQVTISQGLGQNQPGGTMSPAPGMQPEDIPFYRGTDPNVLTPGYNEAASAGFPTVEAYQANLKKNRSATILSDSLQGRMRAAEDDVNARYDNISKSGSSVNPADRIRDVELAKQNAISQAAAEMQQRSAAAEKEKPTQTAEQPAFSADQNALLTQLAATPGGAALAPAFQQIFSENARSQAEAQTMQGDLQASLAQEKASVQEQMKRMESSIKENRGFVEGLLKEIRDDTANELSKQQASADQQMVWAAQKNQRSLARQEVKTREAMIARAALFGGFGQDAALRDIDSSDQAFEDKIRDVETQLGYDRGDLAVRFSGLYTENAVKYREGLVSVLKETQSSLLSLKSQGISNTRATGASERTIMQNAYEGMSALRKENAAKNYQIVKDMQSAISQEQEQKSQKEKDSLARIDYLLKNYPRESVAEAIKELGKNVTSFDVQALIDNPTLDEIAKAEAALAKKSKSGSTGGGGGGGIAASYLPSEMQEPVKPEISFDEFMKTQMDEMETSASQSFAPDKRAKVMAENMDKWQEKYDAMYLSGIRGESASQAKTDLVAQFGQPVVDAAQLIMDGTYTGTDPIGKASKALNVPSGQVATALTKLRMSGAISDTAVLSEGQQKSWKGILSDLKQDTFYSVWNGSKSAVSRIQVAIGDSGGADGISDIMAINAFQNGIVDPGATVREGDVVLMQTAKAWSEIVNLEYQKERVTKGSKLPESMRKKMLQLATATRDAYERDFKAQTIPKFQVLVKQNGLPNSVLDDYLGTGSLQPTTTVSSEVQSFLDANFSQ